VARPGVEISSRAAPPPRGIATDTGVWFVVGAAERGSIASAKLIRNMDEFLRFYGARQSYSLLYDSLEAYFREGGVRAYVARVAGASATTAGRTLNDSQGTPAASLRVDAKNPGIWGNSLSVAVAAGLAVGEFTLVVTHTELGEVDRSPSLADQAAAVSWSLNSDWVTVTIPGGAGTNDPAVAAATALTGGADDNAGITDSQRQAALSLFPRNLGPGQVSIPGNTASGNRAALLAHARANNRLAVLDATDSSSRSALVTEAQALTGDEYGALFAPWVVIPGVVTGRRRTIPASAFVAGLMARNDATNNANVPAAGANGFAQYALDVTQPAWSDLDRETLNASGVNVIRSTNNGVQLYGYRSLGNPVSSQWLMLSNQRLRNKVTADAEAVAEQFLFRQIDGRGHTIAEFVGALTGVLNGYYASGALYGETPEEAFSVDAGESINTPFTLAAGELRAVLSLRMSPYAELVRIEIVKVAISEQL
jgi:phage tail sheath protein FI